MADYVQQERPRDTVVVERDEHDHPIHGSSNTGLIVALVILGIIVLLIIFGGGLFGGGDDNIQAPTPTTPTGQ